ncbi:MAG: alpha/beta hydrolase [Enterovirga sp.]|jgi:pimeloyl-ACP methyl ester carboxylesterase|nr:alpha/beta hydrolase [Enterovirga sp.]
MEIVQGGGEPIVFVHGNGSTRETWAGTIACLTDRFRCISYDLPGHGGAPLPAGDLPIELFVEDLERVRAKFGLERACFVGHSLGAFIAAAYAAAHPERVSALCVLAAPAGRSETDREAGRQLIATLKAEGVPATMGKLVGFWYTDEFVRTHPGALRDRLAQVSTIDDDVFIRTYELYNRTEIMPWLARIACPTLVMTGEFARGAPADAARTIARMLPRSELTIMPGMKNGILTEVPDRVAGEIAAFVARHGAPTGA